MLIVVVLAHPRPGSFCHAVAERVIADVEAAGHTAVLHDLYAEEFDPILRQDEIPRHADLPAWLAAACDEVANANGIVIIHPNWWGMPPAILVGWVDRMMRPGVSYEFVPGEFGQGVPNGLLSAHRALVFNTSNTEDEREQAVFGDPLDSIWRRCIFDLCGITDVRRRSFGVLVTSTDDDRAAWLDDVSAMVDDAFGRSALNGEHRPS